MYSLSTLVPITWNVILPGIITHTTVRINGDKSTNIDIIKSKADTKITKMEGLRVVFYCMGLS